MRPEGRSPPNSIAMSSDKNSLNTTPYVGISSDPPVDASIFASMRQPASRQDRNPSLASRRARQI